MTKIIIADDHQSFADGLSSILQRHIGAVSVHTVSSAEEVLSKLASDSDFTLLITDISMGGMNGVELTRKVKSKYPGVRVLVLSMHNEAEFIRSIMDAEGEGYLLKNSSAKEVLDAVNTILNDGTHYGREVMATMVKKLSNEKTKEKERAKLSERELEVLKLIIEEFSSESIAQRLFISKRTVDAHRANILEKTGCQNIISLIKYAVRNDIIIF